VLLMAAADTAQLARLCACLGNPARLRIFLALARCSSARTPCVCDLVTALRLPQPVLSKHLAALRRAGAVTVERRGTRRLYRLAAAGPLRQLARMIDLADCCR